MPGYSKGKIYKVLHHTGDEIYVGSTIKTLSQRMAQHRNCMRINRCSHYVLFKHMQEIDIEHFYIELIEHFTCNCIYELRAREGHFTREIGTLNKHIAGRNQKDWEVENKEHIH